MHKKLNDFHKKFTGLEKLTPQTKENLKEKVLDNTGNLFNELFYIYKEIYKKEKDALNKKDIKNFDYTKLRLTGYLYESEEEEKQTDKRHDKKELPKKPEKTDGKEINKLIHKEEMGINRELFKKLVKFQRPSSMLRDLYNTDEKRKIMI